MTLGIWLWKHNRAWTIGYLFGFAAHVLTDVNDSIGTMLLFPFTTLNWSFTLGRTRRPSRAASTSTPPRTTQPRAVMDLFWLLVVLASWRVLTREFWRTQVVPADPYVWSWLGQWFCPNGACSRSTAASSSTACAG